MNQHLKLAYNYGVQRALIDAGVVKVANLDEVLSHMEKGLSQKDAWEKAYPGEPVPTNLTEMLREHKDVTEKDANMAVSNAYQSQGFSPDQATQMAYPGGLQNGVSMSGRRLLNA